MWKRMRCTEKAVKSWVFRDSNDTIYPSSAQNARISYGGGASMKHGIPIKSISPCAP